MSRSLRLAGCGLALAGLLGVAAPAAARPVVKPVRPWHPGDMVWLAPPPLQMLTPLSTGCERVPATGYVGANVYTQSASHSAGSWSWSDSSALEPFHWYIFQGTTIKLNARSEGAGGNANLAVATYYWKVQNLGTDPQAWNVCWS